MADADPAETAPACQALYSQDIDEMNVMNAKLVLSVLLACGCAVSAGASEDPANRNLLKQCESAKGEVKEECRDVAKEMIRNDASNERSDTTAHDVTHSSPAMNPPSDAQREAAKKKPKAEEKKNSASQKPANPDPAK